MDLSDNEKKLLIKTLIIRIAQLDRKINEYNYSDDTFAELNNCQLIMEKLNGVDKDVTKI